MTNTGSNPSTKQNLDDRLQAVAAYIFSQHDIDFAAVQRAGGWTNLVWLADDLVLRLSTTQRNESLLREAHLAALFSPDVGYPQVVESGTTDGFAWALTLRLPGRSLGEVWPDLTWEERSTALHDIWQRAQAVHTVPASKAAQIASRRSWFNATDSAEAQASLTHLTEAGILSRIENHTLGTALNSFWVVLPTAQPILCHGDLTLDNAIWHAGRVTALLDFEFAVMAPIQLDLNHLVKCAFGPENTVQDPSPAAIRGAQRLRWNVEELALPLLSQPGEKELLVGYAILLELCRLELWLEHPEGEGPLEEWDPLRRLHSLAEDQRGYLAPLIS